MKTLVEAMAWIAFVCSVWLFIEGEILLAVYGKTLACFLLLAGKNWK